MVLKNLKLAFFDFDSTIIDGETIEFLAEKLNLEKKIASITKDAMEGKIDFFESLIKRVKLLKGLSVNDVNEICSSLPIMPGAFGMVSKLREMNIKVICLSGGFENATNIICKKLGFDAWFSNTLHSKNGILTGKVGGPMMFSYSKGLYIKKLSNLLNIGPTEILSCGDGANDLSMFNECCNNIAFCAKDILKKSASYIIDEKNLLNIIDYINNTD